MPFLVNIITPFPITAVHQLHIVKINCLMAVTHCKTGIGLRGIDSRLRKKNGKMFHCRAITPQAKILPVPLCGGRDLEEFVS